MLYSVQEAGMLLYRFLYEVHRDGVLFHCGRLCIRGTEHARKSFVGVGWRPAGTIDKGRAGSISSSDTG